LYLHSKRQTLGFERFTRLRRQTGHLTLTEFVDYGVFNDKADFSCGARVGFGRLVRITDFRDDQGHRFSQFSPGWPALLAVGVNLGTPWLINPLLGALLIFLMLEYVEQRMGKELVRVASLLLP
jgi:hypothetical protein